MPYTRTTYSTSVSAAQLNNGEAGIETAQATAEAAAVKPATAAGVYYVDPAAGSDSNDGLSWGKAKATIAAAVTACTASGGTVRLSAGVHSISAAVSVPNFLNIKGEGSNTFVRCTGNHYAFNLNPANRVTISGVHVDKNGSAQTSGGGFDFTNAGSRICLEDIYIGNGIHTAINAAPAATANTYIFRRIHWFGTTGHNTGIKIGGGAALVTDVYLSDIVGTASTTSDMGTWLDIPSNADTIKVRSCLFIKGTTGCAIGLTTQVTNLKFTDFTVDQMTGKGIDIGATRVCEFSGQEISTCGAANVPGLDIGGLANLVKFRGGVIQNCGGYGVIIRAGSLYTLLDGVDVIDNNTSNTGFNDGIAVSAGASRFKITRCNVGNGPLGTGHQKIGINVAAGASNNYLIEGNDCFGNETENSVIDGGTGASKRIANNTPNVVPTTASAATITLPSYSDTHVISGTTTITSITASWPDRRVTLIFSGALTLTDGSNLKLAGNFVTTTDDAITLVYDGANWVETARSVN